MGIFDETAVSTAFIAVDMGEIAVLGAQLSTDILSTTLSNSELTPYLINNSLTSLDFSAEAYYQYGLNDYIFGLPGSTIRDYSFFPFATIRQDKANRYNTSLSETINLNENVRNSTNDLLNTMGFSLKSLTESINESPDINSIDDCYFGFNVPFLTENSTQLNYLFNFWQSFNEKWPLDRRYSITGQEVIKDDQGNIINTPDRDNYFTWEIAQDGLEIAIQFTGLVQSERAVRIGGIGDYKVNKVGTEINTLRDHEGDYIEITDYASRDQWHSSVEYLKQITEDTCEVITVYNLVVSSLNRNFSTGYRNDIHVLSDTTDFTAFAIPLERNTLETLPKLKQSSLLNISAVLYFNAISYTKLEWYQSKVFRITLTIVVFVISVFTVQPWLVALVEAAELGIVALITYLAVTVALGYTIGYVLDLAAEYILEEFGVNAAIIVAIIATVISAAISYGTNLNNVVLCDTFLFSVTSVAFQYVEVTVEAINNYMQEGINLLAQEFRELTEVFLEREEAIVDAQAELYMNQDLLDTLIKSNEQVVYFDTNETPDDFYNRTIHSQNIGTFANTAALTFVERSLTLPDIGEDTLALI